VGFGCGAIFLVSDGNKIHGFRFCTDVCGCTAIFFLCGSIQIQSVYFLLIYYKPDEQSTSAGVKFHPQLWVQFFTQFYFLTG
jgi:hypothetical protein